jgi:hypothetical protein
MSKASNIDIFLRVRPVKQPSSQVTVDNEEHKVEFNIPKDASSG